MVRDDRPAEDRREQLAATFDEDAELYDRVRPRYPAELLDDLAELAGAGPGGRVLEIGCGTGLLTVPLVLRGYHVTAVEPGPRMAAVARRNLAAALAGGGPGDDGPAAGGAAGAGAGAGAGARGGAPAGDDPRTGGRTGARGDTPAPGGPRAGGRARTTRGSADVVTCRFEDFALPAEPYDAVVAATAFHWVDPAVRVARAADALRPGGVLAVVRTQHVRGGTEDFFAEAQRCYERFDPSTPPGLRLPDAADVYGHDHAEEVAASGRFGGTAFRRVERELTYTTRQYIDLVQSYSGHRALPAAARDGLLGCLAGLVEARHGGRVTKRYLFELAVSPRL